MKKHLFFLVSLLIFVSSYSQVKTIPIKDLGKTKITFKARKSVSTEKERSVSDIKNQENNSIQRHEIGKSANVYSVLHPEQRCIFYDEKTNYVIFTHGADTLSYPDATSTYSVMTSYMNIEEYDSWSDWDSQISLDTDPTMHQTRFPSGVIYNPDETEVFENTHTVIAGPDVADNLNAKNYFASAKMNGEEQNASYSLWQGDNDWARSCMTTVNEEVYIFGQDFENVGDYGKDQVLKHYRGSTSNPANGFEWEINTVSPDWLINEEEGYAYALYTTWSAWKKDGSIGYMWMIGVTNESQDYGVYQPQVYYTEDGGESWEYIPLNLEDDYTLQEFLEPWEDENGNPMTIRPSFLTEDRTFPGTVDWEGKLHLFSNVYGSTTGDVTNPNESNWINDDHPGGVIFDFIIDADGLKQIEFVDHIYTRVVDSTFGNMGWNHRLQTSKTLDEYNVFLLWSEDVFSTEGELRNPDLKGFSYCDLFGQNFGSNNLTAGDLYEGFYFYPFVGEYATESDYWYDIPVSVSVRPIEYSQNDPSLPITHEYVSGISLPTCVGAVDDQEAVVSIEVSQNQPNPFSKNTSIDIWSDQIEEVHLQIRNALGQLVYEENFGLIYHQKTLALDLEHLESGVYFYSIQMGEELISKKMLKE